MTLVVENLDGVDDSIKPFFVEEDGKFRFDSSKLPDTTKLEQKRQIESDHRKKAEQKASTLETQLKDLQKQIDDSKHNKASENGDVDALNKSWSDKLTKKETELNEQIGGLQGQLQSILVDNVALSMASELAIEGSAQVLVPHIKSRLSAEQKDGAFATVVKDGEGKASALTLDELKEEIANMPAFAPVIVGSKASGSGADGGQGGGAAHGGDVSKMNREQKLAHYRNKRK